MDTTQGMRPQRRMTQIWQPVSANDKDSQSHIPIRSESESRDSLSAQHLRGGNAVFGDIDKNYLNWAAKSIRRLNGVKSIQNFACEFISSCQDPDEMGDKDTIFDKIMECRWVICYFSSFISSLSFQ